MAGDVSPVAMFFTLKANFLISKVGLDYLHGTGHGVGSFLNVHEGPCGISYRVNAKDPGLQVC